MEQMPQSVQMTAKSPQGVILPKTVQKTMGFLNVVLGISIIISHDQFMNHNFQ